MPDYQNDELMNRKEAARFLNFAPNTLAVWDCTKRHDLGMIKIGKAVRYRRSRLIRFLEECKPIKRPKK